MRLSVIIPVYGVAQWLGQCLESVLSQSVQDIELLGVDDGSVDESQDVLVEAVRHDSRVRMICQRNARQGAARNRGLNTARGDYIAFVDPDDWVCPDIWKHLLVKAERDNCQMVLCEAWRVDDATGRRFRHEYETLNLSPRFFRRPFTWRELAERRGRLFGSCVSPCTRIIQRDFVGATRFPLGMLYEDAPFHFELLLRAERIGAIRKPLYYYRQRSGSTMTHADSRVLDHLKVLDRVWESIVANNLTSALAGEYATYAADMLWKTVEMWCTEEAFANCRQWLTKGWVRVDAFTPEASIKLEYFFNNNFEELKAAITRQFTSHSTCFDNLLFSVRNTLARFSAIGSLVKTILPYGFMRRWLRLRYGIVINIPPPRTPLQRFFSLLAPFFPYRFVLRVLSTRLRAKN